MLWPLLEGREAAAGSACRSLGNTPFIRKIQGNMSQILCVSPHNFAEKRNELLPCGGGLRRALEKFLIFLRIHPNIFLGATTFIVLHAVSRLHILTVYP